VRASDPYNLSNSIKDEKYAEIIGKLRMAIDNWMEEVGDKGDIPEMEMVYQMWPGGIQPQTDTPEVEVSKGSASLSCKTIGSSVAYLLSNKKQSPDLDSRWQLYIDPINVESYKFLYVLANRIGFKDSEVVEISLQ
jgi:N-sulfoglucosamine sulfohydrolase